MSRRGNCHDNAVAESFFQLLKRERIRRRIYATRDEAKADVFNYIEMFYNTRRQHGHNDGLASGRVRKAAINLRLRGVYRSRGDSHRAFSTAKPPHRSKP